MSGEPAIRKLSGALRSRLLAELEPGIYRIEYNDSTHVPRDEWRPLLDVEVRAGATQVGGFPRNHYRLYTISSPRPRAPAPTPKLSSETSTTGKEHKADSEAKARQAEAKAKQDEKDQAKLRDVLGQCLLRTGILAPVAEIEEERQLHRLSQKEALVLIPDTNALSNGVVHHLLRSLARTQVWLMPVAVSLTTIQEHDRRLKSLVQDKKGTMAQALRSRTLINASLSLIERCRAHAQVLEVDSQLLRYLRPASTNAPDPDQGDVLEDRLLVEAIHATLRAMRTRAERRVVTSDGFLSRILTAEGMPTLALQPPRLPDQPVPCVRYDPLARAFVGATLPELLWDLAQAFASVRIMRPDGLGGPGGPLARFDAYWDGKTARDWQREHLKVTVAPPSAPIGARLSSAVLPEVPFLQVLRLGGALLEGPGAAEDLRTRIPPRERPGSDVARSACEVLRRAGFAVISEEAQGVMHAGVALSELNDLLTVGSLDQASSDWESLYDPYGELLRALREHGRLTYREIPGILERVTGGKPGRRASEHLARMAVHLGQAWPSEHGIQDGSRRIPDKDAAAEVERLLEDHAKGGLLGMDALLPLLCETLRMSPWAAANLLRRISEAGSLPRLTMSASLGPGRRAREAVPVVQGPLSEVHLDEIPLDRLKLGDRLIYSVTWSAA